MMKCGGDDDLEGSSSGRGVDASPSSSDHLRRTLSINNIILFEEEEEEERGKRLNLKKGSSS